jgi:hypothetical protein
MSRYLRLALKVGAVVAALELWRKVDEAKRNAQFVEYMLRYNQEQA